MLDHRRRGPNDTLAARLAAADTIILVDLPLYLHYWWAIKRQLATLVRPCPDDPMGRPILPMTWPLLKLIWQIQVAARPRLLDLIDTLRNGRQIVHLRSPGELTRFARQLSA